MQDRLQSFAIPSHWFTDSFVTAQAPEFVRLYAEAFADFKRRTPAHFAGIDTLKTRVHVDAAGPVDIRTRRWTPAESNPASLIPALRVPVPTMEKFEIDCVLAAPGKVPGSPPGSNPSSTLMEPSARSDREANPSGHQSHHRNLQIPKRKCALHLRREVALSGRVRSWLAKLGCSNASHHRERRFARNRFVSGHAFQACRRVPDQGRGFQPLRSAVSVVARWCLVICTIRS